MRVTQHASILKNTLTNYAVVGVRLAEGILLTRLLFSELGQAYYGFWGLLWSFFAYVLLLDFGLSQAAQKHTSQRLYETEPERYTTIVSAVFGMQFIMSGVIIAGTGVAVYFLEQLTNIHDPAQLDYCRKALLLLGIGVGLTFPTGLFPSILVAVHKIYLRNYVIISVRVLELCGLFIILNFLGGNLISMVVYCVSLNIMSNMVMLIMVKANIPNFRIRPKFSWKTVKSLSNFSFYIYLIALANILAAKTDRLVLGFFSGLESVGLYQIGTRLPEMAQSAGTQFHENLTPLSAALSKHSDQAELRNLIYFSMRISALLTMAITAIGFLLTPEALNVLFGIKVAETRDAAALVCRMMLISVFFTVGFRSVASRFMMMSGRHKFLAKIQISEAVLNLTLSIVFVKYSFITESLIHNVNSDINTGGVLLKVMGVVLGTLIPNVLISLLVILPYMCSFVHKSVAKILVTVYLIPALAVLPAAGALFLLRRAVPDFTWTFPGFVFAGLMTLCIYLFVIAYSSLTESELSACILYVRGKLNFLKKGRF